MRRALLVVLLAFSLLAVFFARLAWGADFSSVSVFTDNRCSICFLPDYLLHINVDIQDPLGLADITSIVATPFSGSVPGPITLRTGRRPKTRPQKGEGRLVVSRVDVQCLALAHRLSLYTHSIYGSDPGVS